MLKKDLKEVVQKKRGKMMNIEKILNIQNIAHCLESLKHSCEKWMRREKNGGEKRKLERKMRFWGKARVWGL